jgi:FKBP-type peptidyl-prolyl cis-trans isomerase (trigger factor)
MKVEINKIEQQKRRLSIEVNGQIVTQKFDEVYKRIGKEMRIPGFRPGMAPPEVVDKHYGSHVRQEVLKELLPFVYQQAIESERLDAVGPPEISQIKLSKDALSFSATVEIKPQVRLKNYKGIKIKYKTIQVCEEEIKKRLETIKDSQKAQRLDDAFARGLGYADLGELEKALQAQLYLEKEKEQRVKIESTIIDYLTKDVNFSLPAYLVNRQLEEMTGRTQVELALRGMPKEEIDKQLPRIRENLAPEAERQVRIYLILEAIAKKENISVDEYMSSKVMGFLLRQANWITS